MTEEPFAYLAWTCSDCGEQTIDIGDQRQRCEECGRVYVTAGTIVESDREAMWEIIAGLRDRHPREKDDCPSDDLVAALIRAGFHR